MKFEHISANALHSVWPWVRTGLERVLIKSPESWLPEDIYTAIRTGHAWLVIGKDGDHCVGFFVVEVIPDQFRPSLKLNVWIAYATGADGHYAEALAYTPDVVAELDKIAKAKGVNTIRMRGRRGWERALKGYFEPVQTIYERVL